MHFLKTSVVCILTSLLLISCGSGGSDTTPPQDTVADEGDKVSVHYVGTLDDGEEFDSSRKEGRSPLGFVIGDGSMIPGFDIGVRDMNVGDTKNVRIEPEEAYGLDMVKQTLPSEVLQQIITDPSDPDAEPVEFEIGESYTPDNSLAFTVVDIEEEGVVIEFENSHPLAGQALNFEIELLDIEEPAPIEPGAQAAE